MLSKIYYRTTLGDHNSQCQGFMSSHWIPVDPTVTTVVPTTEIVCQIEGAESLHLALEQNQNFHTMSLLVSGTPLCSSCVSALSGYGITAQDTAWTCGKKLGDVHPGLKPTRF